MQKAQIGDSDIVTLWPVTLLYREAESHGPWKFPSIHLVTVAHYSSTTFFLGLDKAWMHFLS